MNNQDLVKKINRRLFIKRTFNRFIADLADIPSWVVIGLAIVVLLLIVKV